MNMVCFQNVEDDHEKEIQKVEDILKDSGTEWDTEVSGKNYGGDYYVRGGLQAIDLYVEYVTFIIKDDNVYNKILSMRDELGFELV